ncbi:tRNA dihydrouridine(20/20a) synthase DusA [Parvularcula sp. ZS-1/3]|uniref:tRNA-dihydrouridine(20/20a) synthase n=1 Tax=Parvularcula mediterranea TaxID=2732508 RepID=A0A7Y3W4G7_9PROT|nr:tRNA dihydrouridine(20/20a) synthase DusA [Parvularcula mediterranea]NNU15443.1 tRNA dihydrouridine(20/20a) synthase DusA [Parvularcula mediterranea]
MTLPPHTFSVAPMIDWTDRYCRFFHRQMTRRALLFTEMVTAEAILNGDRDRLLSYDHEGPTALQLGGSDPAKMGEAARIGAGYGYQEINMNVGCPSDRVQSGRFGACLMAEPKLVRDVLAAMRDAQPLPVTAKCRIGIDDQDPEGILPRFLEHVAEAGVTTVTVHARKAWLQGLSPKENRTIPPLDYGIVERMKARFPELTLILNGGIASPTEGLAHLEKLDGVMLGRAAYERPSELRDVDRLYFADDRPVPDVLEVVETVVSKAEEDGTRLWRYARHMLGLFAGKKGARAWRRRISTEARDAEPSLLLRIIEEEGLAQAAGTAMAAE